MEQTSGADPAGLVSVFHACPCCVCSQAFGSWCMPSGLRLLPQRSTAPTELGNHSYFLVFLLSLLQRWFGGLSVLIKLIQVYFHQLPLQHFAKTPQERLCGQHSVANGEGWKTPEFKTQTTHTRTEGKYTENFNVRGWWVALREVKKSTSWIHKRKKDTFICSGDKG